VCAQGHQLWLLLAVSGALWCAKPTVRWGTWEHLHDVSTCMPDTDLVAYAIQVDGALQASFAQLNAELEGLVEGLKNTGGGVTTAPKPVSKMELSTDDGSTQVSVHAC
jgi:hypothetical protein